MWKKPAQVTNLLVKVIAYEAANSPLLDLPIEVEGDDAAGLLLKWLSDIINMAQTSPSTPVFARRIGEYAVAETGKIERQYSMLLELQATMPRLSLRLTPQYGQRLGLAIDTVLTFFIAVIMVLLGSETKLLVGVNGGRPVWKKTRKIAPDEVHLALEHIWGMTDGVLGNVSHEEAWMIPDFREFNDTAKIRYDKEGDYRDVNAKLLERAFYQQRYLIDTEGVFVKVTGAEDVTGIYLKVLPRPNALVDILARVEMSNGAIFLVITEEVMIEGATAAETYVNGGSYYDYLVCQLYHDLVTATEVLGDAIKREGSSGSASSPPIEHRPSWTVIPRKIRNVERVPRTEIPHATVSEPRRIRGHTRKGQMTERHRQELLCFERETGFEVLRFVPEGRTFVRPHFSPNVSNEELASMPRFIRYRIQKSLEAAMQETEPRE